MKNKIGRKIAVLVAVLLFSELFGLVLSPDIHAESNADMVWKKCGSISTDSIAYYTCAKSNLGLGNVLVRNDLVYSSDLYNALDGETSRGSFNFDDALVNLEDDTSLTETDRKAVNCTKEASGWGWFACGLNKAAGGMTAVVYPKIQQYLSMDPTIFSSKTLEKAWNRFRIFADIILVGMIMVMIISQITGFGISNYGIKKSLPRIIAAAIIINLSFLLCRIAIDVANIIGDGVGAVFDGLAASAKAKINFQALTDPQSETLFMSGVSAGGVLSGIMAFFATKTALASGQSMTLLIFVAVLSVVIGILLLLTVIQLRKALIILLAITSPVAVLLYILPGTKKTFNQWFGLFRGLLLAYPICSLMVKGGAFAANVILAAMGVSDANGAVNIFTIVIAVAASVVPIFLIPRTIIQSAGALGAKLQGLANRLRGFVAGQVRNSSLGKRLDRGAKERANRMRAGVNKRGDKAWWGIATRSRNDRQRLEAAKRAQQDRALRRSDNNAGEMARYEEMDQQAKATEEMLASVGNEGMPDKIAEIINSDGTAQDIAAQISGAVRHWNTVNDKNDADGCIAAALDNLGDGERAKEIRREVARKRLADSDGALKRKHGAMRQYYKAMASDNPPTGDAAKWNAPLRDGNGDPKKDANGNVINTNNQWVEKLLQSDDFNAEWLTDVAKPQIWQLEDYMETASSANSDDYKRQIASTYADMKKLKAYQNATASDYDGLEAKVNKFNAAHP